VRSGKPCLVGTRITVYDVLEYLASKDSDFRQRAPLFGPPPHVVWLRVGNASTGVIEVLLRPIVQRLEQFMGSGEESLLVLSLAV
jgi:predicted nuclease of predicted toxin-antitoxin system